MFQLRAGYLARIGVAGANAVQGVKRVRFVLHVVRVPKRPSVALSRFTLPQSI